MAGVDTFLKFNEGENFKLSEEGVFGTCECGEHQLLCGSQFFNPSVSFGIPKIGHEYAWQPPPQGWVKLNVDGSCLGNPGPASIGGLLRDTSSNWLCGFGLNIGEMSILNAEIIGISIGLQLAWSMGFRRVIAESDSLEAVRLINEKDISAHPLGHLIQDCRTLLSLDWCCSLSHVYRERNFSADSLAKQSHGLKIQELTIWDSPPWKVLRFLNDDKLGVGFRRH
uniref:RNase H type-1 domain-containing protein n=1 Tax=Manihot esculenta TaxID=3983 RepID=A0A2C9U0T0_MANES